MILSFPGLVSLVVVWVLALASVGAAVTSLFSTDVPSKQQKKIDDLIARPAVRCLSRTHSNVLSGPVSEPARLKYIIAGLAILLMSYIHSRFGGL